MKKKTTKKVKFNLKEKKYIFKKRKKCFFFNLAEKRWKFSRFEWRSPPPSNENLLHLLLLFVIFKERCGPGTPTYTYFITSGGAKVWNMRKIGGTDWNSQTKKNKGRNPTLFLNEEILRIQMKKYIFLKSQLKQQVTEDELYLRLFHNWLLSASVEWLSKAGSLTGRSQSDKLDVRLLNGSEEILDQQEQNVYTKLHTTRVL